MMIKCESCGKRYDYYKEESCPFCGCYNTPADGRTHSCTTRELEQSGEEHREAHRPAAGPSWSRPATGKGTGRPGATKPVNPWAGGVPRRTVNTVRMFERDEKRRGGKGKGAFIFVLVLLLFALPILAALIQFVKPPRPEPVRSPDRAILSSNSDSGLPSWYAPPSGGGTSSGGSLDWYDPTPESGGAAGVTYSHRPGDAFSLSGLDVVIGDASFEPMSDPTVPQDQWLTLVSIPVTATLTDKDRMNETYPPDPILIYGTGEYDYAEPINYSNYPGVVEALGEESLDFFDVAFGTPMVTRNGTLYFFVPTSSLANGQLVLGLDEYSDDSSYTLISYHEVRFNSPISDSDAPQSPGALSPL